MSQWHWFPGCRVPSCGSARVWPNPGPRDDDAYHRHANRLNQPGENFPGRNRDSEKYPFRRHPSSVEPYFETAVHIIVCEVCAGSHLHRTLIKLVLSGEGIAIAEPALE